MPSKKKMIKNIDEIIADSEELKAMILQMQQEKREQIRRMNVFSSDDPRLVSYESLMELPKSQPVQISEGVVVERSSSDYDNNLHLIARLVKDAKFPQHFHSHWEYKLLTRGKLLIIYEQKTEVVQVGQVYEINPYELHEVVALMDSVVRVIGAKEQLIPEETDFKK